MKDAWLFLLALVLWIFVLYYLLLDPAHGANPGWHGTRNHKLHHFVRAH